MKQKFIEKTFHAGSLALIDVVNSIISEYAAMGYTLTLRQAFYQLVSRGYIENSERSYKNIGDLVRNARMAGLMDIDALEDRTRYLRQLGHFNDPAEVLRAAHDSYRLDKWQDQPCYAEIWIEKDALVDIAEKAANKLDVPCFSCRGYASISALYDAAQRFIEHGCQEARYIIYLGDHDPSGLDMPRNILERMTTFGADVEVRRIALTMDQIEQFNPPPNPAKTTDARAGKYIRQYGHESWELDALEPQVLEDLIENEVMGLMDLPLYWKAQARERREKTDLDCLAKIMADHGPEAIQLLKANF